MEEVELGEGYLTDTLACRRVDVGGVPVGELRGEVVGSGFHGTSLDVVLPGRVDIPVWVVVCCVNDEVLPELAIPCGVELSSLSPLSLLLEVSEVEVLSGGYGSGGSCGGSLGVVGLQEFLETGGANQEGNLFLSEVSRGPGDLNGSGGGVSV
jgi:hypothetical protein